jgi:hypothetical protein
VNDRSPDPALRALLDDAARQGSSPPRPAADARRHAEQARRRRRGAGAGLALALVVPAAVVVGVGGSGRDDPVVVVVVPADPRVTASPAGPTATPSTVRGWQGFAFPDLARGADAVDSTLSMSYSLDVSLPQGCGEQPPRPPSEDAMEQVLEGRGLRLSRGVAALTDASAAARALADLRRAWARCPASGGSSWTTTAVQLPGADEAVVVTGVHAGNRVDLHLVARVGRVLWFGGQGGATTGEAAGRQTELAVLGRAFDEVAAELRARWPHPAQGPRPTPSS